MQLTNEKRTIKQNIEDIQCTQFFIPINSSAQLPEIAMIQKEVSELKARLEELSSSRSQSCSQQPSTQLQALREKEGSALQLLNKMSNDLSRLASNIDFVSRIRDSLQEKNVNRLAESIDSLQSQLNSQETRLKEYKAKYAELNTVVQTLQQKTSDTQLRITVLKSNQKYRAEKSQLDEMEVTEWRNVKSRKS